MRGSFWITKSAGPGAMTPLQPPTGHFFMKIKEGNATAVNSPQANREETINVNMLLESVTVKRTLRCPQIHFTTVLRPQLVLDLFIISHRL